MNGSVIDPLCPSARQPLARPLCKVAAQQSKKPTAEKVPFSAVQWLCSGCGRTERPDLAEGVAEERFAGLDTGCGLRGLGFGGLAAVELQIVSPLQEGQPEDAAGGHRDSGQEVSQGRALGPRPALSSAARPLPLWQVSQQESRGQTGKGVRELAQCWPMASRASVGFEERGEDGGQRDHHTTKALPSHDGLGVCRRQYASDPVDLHRGASGPQRFGHDHSSA